jgi:hypothetical protein
MIRALDTYLPDFEVRERHSISVSSSPARVYEGLHEVRVADMPLSRLLFWLRSMPRRLSGRPASRVGDLPLLDRFRRGGAVILLEDPGRGLVLGLVGRFWRLTPGDAPRLDGAAGFATFAQPGYAKAVISFEIEPTAAGSRLVTETRVRTTDETARRSFRRYWSIIRLGSGLTRRSMLRAVKRLAEAG